MISKMCAYQAYTQDPNLAGEGSSTATPIANDNPATVLFLSENLEVLFVEGSTTYLLITFNEAGEPANGRRVWGDTLIRSAGITTLGFMTRRANWFPETDMREAAAALMPLLSRFPERVLFGHSMGGYGAIKFSRLLGCSVALSFCPQYSINPADVGSFDDRYIISYEPALHADMRISSTDVSGAIYIFYDPLFVVDRHNVNMIYRAAPSVQLMPMANTGHGTITGFRGRTLATRLFSLCRDHDINAIRGFAATRRRTHEARGPMLLTATAERRLARAAAVFGIVCANMQPDMAVGFAHRIATLAYQRGDMEASRKVMQRAIEVFPDNLKLLECFAQLKSLSGDVPGALQMACRLSDLDPANVNARLQVASLLSRSGDPQAARQEAVEALRTNPKDIRILRMLAGMDQQRNKFEQVVEWLHRAIEVEPDNADLYDLMAKMMVRSGALADAQKAAEKALLLKPAELSPLNVLADIAQRSGDLPGAIAVLRRATAMAPSNVLLRSWLARLLLQCGALDEAREQAESALELAPANVDVLTCLVEIARCGHRLEEVVRWARAVAEASMGATDKMEWAARVLVDAGDLEGGRNVVCLILATDPSHAGALRCLADIDKNSANPARPI
jgi:tetratricopeptide (TPR) repeat protein